MNQFFGCVALALSTCCAPALAAVTYDFQPFDVPNSRMTSLLAINNGGQIVGQYQGSDGIYKGFFYDGNSARDLDFPGAATTIPYGINDKGDIVGGYLNPGSPQQWRSFVRSSTGAYTSLPDLNVAGINLMIASGINNRGDIVGTYTVSGGSNGDGFLYRDGAYELLDDIWPNDITDAGLIVGTRIWYEGIIFSDASSITSFKVSDTGAIWNTLGWSIATDGTVAGTYFAANEKGFVRGPDGSITTLTYPSASRTTATGMNDNHTIVGTYYDDASPYLRTRGFIAHELRSNVVPEPGTFALASIGLLAMVRMRSRQQRCYRRHQTTG